MSQKVESFAEINLRRLQSVLSDVPVGRVETNSPENLYYSDPLLKIPQGHIFTCAIASAVNAVRSLGINASEPVPTLVNRLLAAQINRERAKQPALIKNVLEDFYFVTDEGLNHLFKLIKQPIGKTSLPIIFEESFDMGKVHQALCHGYKAVGVIDDYDHAVAFTGIMQQDGNTFWQVIPPDTQSSLFFNSQDGKFSPKNIIPITWVDVKDLASSVKPHFFIVGDELNQWKLPPDSLEVGEDIELNFE